MKIKGTVSLYKEVTVWRRNHTGKPGIIPQLHGDNNRIYKAVSWQGNGKLCLGMS